jgi:hypothetical protein
MAFTTALSIVVIITIVPMFLLHRLFRACGAVTASPMTRAVWKQAVFEDKD